MNWWKKFWLKRKLKKFARCIKIVEANGYSVVKLVEIAKTMYVEDRDGTRYALKKDKKREKKSGKS